MPAKIEFYADIADRTARQITSSFAEWTAFLATAARLYKYPYHEQLMIYAQKPDATACAEYGVWNDTMKRYVRRGSNGIALIDTTGDNPKLKYVFDVSDTGEREHSRPFKLWEYNREHFGAVSGMLEKNYSVPASMNIADQLEKVAAQRAGEYWNDFKDDILDIVANSFLEEYDDLNVEAQFKNAVTVSTTYALLSRCNLSPEDRFEHEDFLSVFDFNTPETVAALGCAVSEISEQVLRQIEITVKNYERTHENDLHEERGLQYSERGVDRTADFARQIRQDEEELSANTSPDIVESLDTLREAVPAFAGDRRDGEPETLADDAGADESERRNGAAESDRPDEVDRTDEQPESAGGGNDFSGADLQLKPVQGLQMSLFPTEDEQIQYIDEAESDNKLFAFSVSSADLDVILQTGSNNSDSRMRTATEFMKNKSAEEIADYLRDEYYGGKGFHMDNNDISAWFADDGIHLAKGSSAQYVKTAQIIPWIDAVEHIHEMLDAGTYATNIELAEAPGYERKQLAESLWYVYHDLSEEAHERGFLPSLGDLSGSGFPDETAKLAEKLNVLTFRTTLTREYAEFTTALAENRDLMRFHYNNTADLLRRLQELDLPRTNYTTEMTSLPEVRQFITEDEINDALKTGSGVSDGKNRIAAFFAEIHSTKEQADFLKNEYGIGGRSHAVSRSQGSDESHDSKGIRLKKADCADVELSWSNVAKRIESLVKEYRYIQRKPAETSINHEAEYSADGRQAFSEKLEITPDDIEAALIAWNGDDDSKRRVNAYMRDHSRERDTSGWLKSEYGKDTFTVTAGSVEAIEVSWAKVQRGIGKLVAEDRFFTEPDSHIDEMLAQAEAAAAANEVEPYERFAVIETANGYGIWDDLHDGYYVDDAGVTEEFLSEWQANDYLEEVKKAVSEKENAEWLYVERAKSDDFPFIVGDTVYLEDKKAFIIENIGMFDIQLRDPTLLYPILRSESRESFNRLMERYPQREQPENPNVQSTFSTTTEAIYPGEKNGLPYDIVIERLHTDEPEPKPENFHISDDNLGIGGAKVKFRANMDAITTLQKIESENRFATPDEQEILSKYVGWGGLSDAFDETKTAWINEFKELQAALSPEEYAAARASTLNAHYTSPTVIKAIYEAVGNMGFTSGNILEPAMGVGNFFGCLPREMSGSQLYGSRETQLYGVELDGITGRIAKQLYPKANITVAGFETTDRRDFFDLAVGNVPFGQYQVNDRAYNKLGFSIHDYFFAKSLDQVRAGGVIAFVTSRYTLDKQSPEVRKYIAQRADFLGAIRLPNNAFKANAGTEVVSDIVFLQKRDRPIDIEPDWIHLGQNNDGFAINSYFVDHPDMILGRQSSESTQYGRQDFTVEPIEGASLAEQLAEAIKNIRGTYVEAELPELGEGETVDTSIPADPNVKNYSYTVVDDTVYYRENSRMVKPELNATAAERVKGMAELRDCAHKLIDQQLDGFISDDMIKETQADLSRLYDSFTEKYGLINSRANAIAFADDSSYYLLCSLEILDDDGNLSRKADMFTKRTIKPHEVVTSVDTASEALALSISEKACVDMTYMSQLTGKGEKELASDLRGVVFVDPTSEKYVAADEYLSGDVREKLRLAKLALPADAKFADNVEALEVAQPKDLDASEIEVRLGATWIDKEYIQQFMHETFNPAYYLRRTIEVNYSEFTAEWSITGKNQVGYNDVNAYMTYGTERANAYKILEDTLNLRDVRIYDTVTDPDGKERRVLNSKETTLAQQKQQAIKDAFSDWIWRDADRRQTLVAKYNTIFNSTRPREYNGQHITFTGMNPEIRLREHQLNAIAHVLYGGNTLLAHEVGAGKSATRS